MAVQRGTDYWNWLSAFWSYDLPLSLLIHLISLTPLAAAVCAMGLAGEIGYSHMKDGDGNSTYRNRIIDAIYNMDGDSLEKGAKYEVR